MKKKDPRSISTKRLTPDDIKFIKTTHNAILELQDDFMRDLQMINQMSPIFHTKIILTTYKGLQQF